MAKVSRNNRRKKDRGHTIRNNTRKQSQQGKNNQTATVVGVTPDEQLKAFFQTIGEKFPKAVEALKGKFTGFDKMSFDQMIERTNQFLGTMAFGIELQKSKNVAHIEKQLTPVLERAEGALQEIAW